MKLNKRKDLLTIWQMSKFESVRQVAQNSDILKLLFREIDPMFQYNNVVKEHQDPRFKQHLQRLYGPNSNGIHPGRWLVHITYPQLYRWPYCMIGPFKCEDINLYGCMVSTTKTHWQTTNNVSSSIRSFTHEDLNQLLASLGYTGFSSKNKQQKIRMLMQH
eukprot:COSAG06_NODE_9799_length_1814_cov_1.228571_2_plen_161_part_00